MLAAFGSAGCEVDAIMRAIDRALDFVSASKHAEGYALLMGAMALALERAQGQPPGCQEVAD